MITEKGQALDVKRELQLCERTATLYPRNYYAWTYRHWLLTQMDRQEKLQEYKWSRQWVTSHISDHSGIQHLQRCLHFLPVLLKIAGHCRWLREHIKRYPGHESLWCHMRFCAYMAGARQELDFKAEPAFIEEVLKACKDSDGDDENIQKQRQLVLRYGLWITHLVSTKLCTNAK